MSTRSLLGLLSFAFGAHLASAQTVVYPDFPDLDSTGGLTLNGAVVVDGAIQLASRSNDRRGSVFTDELHRVGVEGFSAVFEFQIESPGGVSDGTAAGADGLAFVLQRVGSTALGSLGEGLGYEGIGSSLAVEFDTFRNSRSSPAVDDISSNHVGINLAGSMSSIAQADVGSDFAVAGRGFALDNGGKWVAWVDYNGTTLEVRLSQTGVRPASALLAQAVDLNSVLGGSTAYVGFTGATGQATGDHRLLGFAFSETYLANGIAAVPEPSTYALLALGMGFVGWTVWRRRR